MKMQNSLSFPLSLLLSLSLLLLPQIPAVASGTAAPAPPATAADLAFIRDSCKVTEYPARCLAMLLPHAARIGGSQDRLTRAAMAVALAQARKALSVFDAALPSSSSATTAAAASPFGGDRRAAAALNDCKSLFGDAADEIGDSMAELRRLRNLVGEARRFAVSNVQTWVSAALTDQDTCTDGFNDVRASPVKSGVSGRVEKSMECTSNALALVNALANQKP